MHLRKTLSTIAATILLSVAFWGCTAPTDYTVYGILYTDDANGIPMADTRLDFTASDYNTLGYAITDANGKFAFFFWDDGNGNSQNVSGRKDIDDLDSDDLVVTQPLTITLDGKVLFSGNIARNQYTKDHPMILFPGCYDPNASTTKGGAE